MLAAIDPVLESTRPDLAIVQGDTTTTLAAALGAFYRGIPVAHVEAGLRTGDLRQPFPEEMNRVLTARLTALHFAPTGRAAEALSREGADRASVFVTGNTGIDAVLFVRDALVSGALRAPEWEWLDAGRQLILVTSHRRENFGAGVQPCYAGAGAAGLAGRRTDRISGSPQPECDRPGARDSRRDAQRDAAGPAPLRPVCGPDAPLPADHHGFGRDPGGSAVVGQAGAGAEGQDGTPGSGGSRHGETGGDGGGAELWRKRRGCWTTRRNTRA